MPGMMLIPQKLFPWQTPSRPKAVRSALADPQTEDEVSEVNKKAGAAKTSSDKVSWLQYKLEKFVDLVPKQIQSAASIIDHAQYVDTSMMT